jgi:hypothetical protein
MNKKKAKEKNKKSSKKAYVKPKIKKHGSLQGISERVTGATTACCLTERARGALKDSSQRSALIRDVADIVVPSSK